MKRNMAKGIFQRCFFTAMLLCAISIMVNAQPKNRTAAGPARSKSAPANTVNKRKTVKPATVNTSNKNVNNVQVNNNKTVNVNNSKNVNVNVNNSRNTVVIHNTRHYPHPPYVYGGHRYYCYHPYYYHPYHPYYCGPAYHPVGFFIAAMTATAIIVTVESQKYHYDQGVYYVATTNGYTVVQAPVGATVTTLPATTQTVVVNETTNNYYYGNTYYAKTDSGYKVVPPTAGTVVENLPEGGKEEKIGDVTYVKVGDTYYQPIQKNGKNMYEVVLIEEDKKAEEVITTEANKVVEEQKK